MLADSEELDAYLLRADAFGDHIADRLGMGDRLAVSIAVAVPEGVEPEDERERCWLSSGGALPGYLIGHVNTSCLDCASARARVRATVWSAAMARSNSGRVSTWPNTGP